MSRDPLPEPWRSALETKGISSKRGLASKAGISPQTAKRLIDGEGSPSMDTVTAVADAVFDGDRNLVWDLAGLARQDFGDWNLPPEASLLDPMQREVVRAVVRAMLPPELRAGDGNDRDATPIGAVADERSARSFRSGVVHMTAGSGKTQGLVQLMLSTANGDPYRAAVVLTERYLHDEVDHEHFILVSEQLRQMRHASTSPAAARRGESIGRQIRGQQDADATAGQDEGEPS